MIDLKNSKNNVVSIKKNSEKFTWRRESITSDKSELKEVFIPEHLINISLFRGYISYSKTESFMKMSSGSQRHYATSLKQLINFFEVKCNF